MANRLAFISLTLIVIYDSVNHVISDNDFRLVSYDYT